MEYLTLVSTQGKILPLSVEQRVSLVKSLLNSELKKFDFEVTGIDQWLYAKVDPVLDADVQYWDDIYDDLWVLLSAQCPNLDYIQEIKLKEDSRLTSLISNFKSLTCLETTSIIDTGMHCLYLTIM